MMNPDTTARRHGAHAFRLSLIALAFSVAPFALSPAMAFECTNAGVGGAGGAPDDNGEPTNTACGAGAEASSFGPEFGATAVGDSAKATNKRSTAIGAISVASGNRSTAIGGKSRARGRLSTAIGARSDASGGNSTATGVDSEASGLNSTALGQASTATAVGSTALGQSSQATAMDSTALGQDATATGAGSTALGTTASAYGTNGIALGRGAVAGVSGSTAITNNIAIGNGAQATGGYSIAIGTGNVVSGANSGAFGDPNTVTGAGSYAFGNDNTIDANNAYVLGNNVTIGTSLNGAVVLGNNSTVSAATATPSATIGGTTYSFAGGAPDDGDVVSVGSVGNERQIQNVAAGELSATSTDAVNGSQLFGTNQQVTTNTGDITNNTTAITGLSNDALLWNPGLNAYDASHGSASPQKIANVAAGTLNATSTDAVNGSQLHATNQQVNTNTTDIATNTGDITNNSTAITGLSNDALLWNPGLNAYDASHGSASPQQIANVAAGTDNTDAVNVGQLNSSIAAAAGPCVVNGTGIQCSADDSATAGGANSIAIGPGSQASGDQSIAIGNGNVVSGNNSGAFGDPNTVTGAGSYAFGNNNTIDADNAFVVGNNVTIGTGLNGAVALGNNSTVTAATPTAGATIGGNNYTFAGGAPAAGAVVSVGSVGNERQIQNVAAGELSATSTDAVNGSQLHATNQQVNTNTTDIATNTGDIANNTSQVNTNTGDIATNTGDIANNTTDIANNTSQINTNTGDIATNTTDIANNTTQINTNTGDIATNTTDIATNTTDISNNTTDIANNTTQINTNTGDIATNTTDIANLQNSGVRYDNPATKDKVTLGGTTTTDGGTTNGTTITNLHKGDVTANSSDAVNGSQLYEVKQTANAGWNVTTNGNAASQSNVGPRDGVDFSTAGSNLTVTNTGNDLTFAMSADLDLNSVTTGNTVMNNSGVTVDDGAGNVTQVTTAGTKVSNAAGDSTRYGADGMRIQNGPSVTTGGVDAGGQKVTHVAAGTAPTDAVNVQQLNTGLNNAKNWSRAYTDKRIQQLGDRMQAGVASAMAMTGLPQAFEPGQSATAFAVSQFEGESAVAIGVSTVSDSGRYVMKFNLSANTENDFGATAGAAILW